MRRLKVANQDLGNEPQLRAHLATEGYLYFKGLLDPNRIESLRAQLVTVLETAGWLAAERADGHLTPSDAVHLPDSSAYHDLIVRLQSLEELHALAFDSRLLSIIGLFVNGDVVPHPRKMVRVTYPVGRDADSTIPPHQDFRYVQGAADTLTTWIPIGDCDRDMGGLRLLPHSHRRGIMPIVAAGRNRCGIVEVADDEDDWSTSPYEAGDVVLFHSLLVHAGTPNVSSQFRLSVDFRYQGSVDPIAQCQLLPPFSPHVPGWDVLAEGWASREWVTIPSAMNVVADRPVEDDLEIPPSRILEDASAVLQGAGRSRHP